MNILKLQYYIYVTMDYKYRWNNCYNKWIFRSYSTTIMRPWITNTVEIHNILKTFVSNIFVAGIASSTKLDLGSFNLINCEGFRHASLCLKSIQGLLKQGHRLASHLHFLPSIKDPIQFPSPTAIVFYNNRRVKEDRHRCC